MAGFNEMLEKGAKGLGDLVSHIQSSQFVKNVLPDGETFGKELGAYIESNQAVKASLIREELNQAVGVAAQPFLRKAGVSEDDIAAVNIQLAKALEGTDYSDKALETLAEIMQKHNVDQAKFEAFKKIASQNVQDTFSAKHIEDIQPSVVEGVFHPKRYAATYFGNPDKTIKRQRIAAVAGSYVGVSVGARLLQGGNLTHDEYGQKNIAGIPFI